MISYFSLISIRLSYYFVFYLIELDMSRGRLSRSKDKLLPTAPSPIDILYKGIRRKISQTQYVKIFPCLKIRSRMTTKAFSWEENDCNEEEMQWEIMKMREDNKKVEEVNCQLRGRIRKQEKLNEIFEKKIDGRKVECLSFEKILEIKLLMEVQTLQERMTEGEMNLKEVMERTRQRREELLRLSEEPQLALYLILNSFSKGFSQLRQQKIFTLQSQTHSISSLNSKIHALKVKNKQKSQILEEFEQQISVSRQKMHVPRQLTSETIDATAGCSVNRTKTIEEVRSEIERARQCYKQWEVKIQEEMDEKIKRKLIIEKEMQDLANRMEEIRCSRGVVQKIIKW